MAVSLKILQKCEQSGIRDLADLVRKAIADGKNVTTVFELNNLVSDYIETLKGIAEKTAGKTSLQVQSEQMVRLSNPETRRLWLATMQQTAAEKMETVKHWEKIKSAISDIFRDELNQSKHLLEEKSNR